MMIFKIFQNKLNQFFYEKKETFNLKKNFRSIRILDFIIDMELYMFILMKDLENQIQLGN